MLRNLLVLLLSSMIAQTAAECTSMTSCEGSTGGWNPGNCLGLGSQTFCCCGSESSPEGKMCETEDDCTSLTTSFVDTKKQTAKYTVYEPQAPRSLKCDGQNTNFLTSCPEGGHTQPCANAYRDTMSDTGCGLLYQEACYQCCVEDTNPGCADNWANCGYNDIGGTVICPHEDAAESLSKTEDKTFDKIMKAMPKAK